jgi:hypothetical protein
VQLASSRTQVRLNVVTPSHAINAQFEGCYIAEPFGVLAERANNGALSEDERAEYGSLVNAADLISILKLKAGRQLKAHRS